MAHLGKHAIVIGASIGGLLAARALADRYDKVTIIERDELSEAFEPRKGVPQGLHTHGLLARGRDAIEGLFPDLSEEMIAKGAMFCDLLGDLLWFNHGCYLHSAPAGMRGLAMSRPLLEGHVRRRLLQLPNVLLRDQCDVQELVFDRSTDRVTGVRVRFRVSGIPDRTESLEADLVVDAGGRGSRSPAWLHGLGYDKPREETVQVNIGYMTRQFRRRPEHLDGKLGVIMAACPPTWRFGALLAQEGERWIVSLGGYFGDHVPAGDAGFIEYARSLPQPEIFDVVKDAEPVSPLMPYMFNANLRRHYETLSRFPDGYLVVGDAVCSFNPVYGQGMTVACMESLVLTKCLAAGTEGLSRRFFQAISRLIDIPWQIAVGSDLQHPRVEGKRTPQVRFINWYIGKLYQAAHRDSLLARRFLEVANLSRQPPSLLDPRIALRVWRGNRAIAKWP
jgi:2-polyprenyl-6-methoxyphenol hydroxylase-like FAD-dependent oxidoreductase